MTQLTKFSIFAALVYFVQATGSVGGLASNTVRFFCKEGLQWSPEQMAYFMAVIATAWFIKPLLGLVLDLLPICGYRRKSYIYLANTAAILLWWSLAWMAWSGLLVSFWWLAGPMVITGLCFAVTDVAADGLTVQTGREAESEGDLQAIQWTAIYVGLLLTTVLSVRLAQYVMPDTGEAVFAVTQTTYNRVALVFMLTSLFPIVNLITTSTLVKEKKTSISREQLRSTLHELRLVVSHWPLWLLAICIFALHFSPGFGSPLFYYIRDRLGPNGGQMPKMWFAWLSMWDMGVAVVGILLFKWYWKRINIRRWLYVSAVAGVIATLWYLWVDDVWDLVIIATCFGTIGGFVHVAFLTIAAKNTPPRVEAVVFAGYCAVFNVARSMSDAFGGWLYGRLEENISIIRKFDYLDTMNAADMGALRPLVILSAAFTCATIPFITLMRLDRGGTMKWRKREPRLEWPQ